MSNSKTVVIYHGADYDGIFCREIARKFLPEAELIGWDYGDKPLPFPADGSVHVLDLSPDCFESLPADYKERLTWIDHHKSAIEKYPRDIIGCRIDGVSACRLTWQWFTSNQFDPQVHPSDYHLPAKNDYINRLVSEPYAVRLAGEYDIWDKRDPNADVFQFGLRSRKLTDSDWNQLLSLNRKSSIAEVEGLIDAGHNFILDPDGTMKPAVIFGLLETGALLQRYENSGAAIAVNAFGFVTDFEGLRFLALNTPRKGSLAFAAKDVPETGHDALLKFNWTGKIWDVSLYHAKHRTDLDLSQIAVKHGGGGHRGACGFRCNKLPFIS